MTEKETFVNMLRKAVKERFKQASYGNHAEKYYDEFEEAYFLENKDVVHVYNANDDCINFYFDKDEKLNFFD